MKETQNKKTQKERVLEYLKEHGQITNLDAVYQFGLTCLQVTIQELRKEHEIETVMTEGENRFGQHTRYGVYVYKGELNSTRNDCLSNSSIK